MLCVKSWREHHRKYVIAVPTNDTYGPANCFVSLRAHTIRATLYCCVMRQSLVTSVRHDVMLQSFVKTLRGLSFAVDARCDRGGTRSGLAHHSVAYMLGRHQGRSSRCHRRPDPSVVASPLWCHHVVTLPHVHYIYLFVPIVLCHIGSLL